MFIACRLAKSGYFEGDPQKVLYAPADIVENIISFEAFDSDYKSEYSFLNKPKT